MVLKNFSVENMYNSLSMVVYGFFTLREEQEPG